MEDSSMKKIYIRPNTRQVNLQADKLLNTDSNGLKRSFKSRESYTFEDDEEEEVTKNVWFND
jgi:hypothetical protein